MVFKDIFHTYIRQLLLFLFLFFIIVSILLFIGSFQNYLVRTQILLVSLLDISGILYILISIPYSILLIVWQVRKSAGSDIYHLFRIIFCSLLIFILLFLFHFIATWLQPGV